MRSVMIGMLATVSGGQRPLRRLGVGIAPSSSVDATYITAVAVQISILLVLSTVVIF